MKPGFLMKPTHVTALLVAASALLLSSCDIPATGVVEAGGPASGIPRPYRSTWSGTAPWSRCPARSPTPANP